MTQITQLAGELLTNLAVSTAVNCGIDQWEIPSARNFYPGASVAYHSYCCRYRNYPPPLRESEWGSNLLTSLHQCGVAMYVQ